MYGPTKLLRYNVWLGMGCCWMMDVAACYYPIRCVALCSNNCLPKYVRCCIYKLLQRMRRVATTPQQPITICKGDRWRWQCGVGSTTVSVRPNKAALQLLARSSVK